MFAEKLLPESKSAWIRRAVYALYRHAGRRRTFGSRVRSEVPLDVVVPAVPKDLPVLVHCIQGARMHLRHPVGRIVIVGPTGAGLEGLCAEVEASFVDEDAILPFQRRDIHVDIGGYDRSGWLFQQFLKLSADAMAEAEHVLLLDSDTVLVAPQVFEYRGRDVLLHSDDYHLPYFDLIERLLGFRPRLRLSFTSHQMVVRRRRLAELRRVIEARHASSWHAAIVKLIDRSQDSFVSDYEMYGQWLFRTYPNEVWREYWFNRSLRREALTNVQSLSVNSGRGCRSISFHSWMT